MSPGMESNGLLFLTGMTGHREGGASSDPEQQFRGAFDKVRSVLVEAGLDMSRLVEMTTYHVNMSDHMDVFRRVRDEYVTEPYPAWTAIEVSGFVTDGILVEIRAIADTTDA